LGFLYHALAWGAEWVDEILPILIMFCMWFHCYDEVVSRRSLLLVHWTNAYMGDVLNGYQKVQNGTLDVVVHEWAYDLHTSLENLNF